MSIHVFLVFISGIFWTIVYIDAIRIGFKYKTYAIPFWALALNIAWELLCTVFGIIEVGVNEQIVVNIVWFIFDVFIVYTYFKYGFQDSNFTIRNQFNFWSIVIIGGSFLIQYLFIYEFGLIRGVIYAAFLQNLIMSVLFINLLEKRQSSKGQSMLIAISKCIGTIAPTILFGYLGTRATAGPVHFVLGVGALILVFDIMYIYLLYKTIKSEKRGKLVVV